MIILISYFNIESFIFFVWNNVTIPIPPMGIMNHETVKEFCDNIAQLQYICREFSCNADTRVYTKAEAEYLSSIDDDFRIKKEESNQEKYEIYEY